MLIKEEELENMRKWVAIQTTITDTVLKTYVAYSFLSSELPNQSTGVWNKSGPIHMK